MQKVKKRKVLLLEVLIAFALVVMCAFPMLYPHVFMVKSEKRFVREVELDRLVDILYADILEQLYKNEIGWETLQTSIQRPLQNAAVAKLNYKGYYMFEDHSKNGKEEGQSHHLLELTFTFYPADSAHNILEATHNKSLLKYTYNVYIERKLKVGQKE